MKDIFNSNPDPAKQALIVCNHYYTKSAKAIINIKEIDEHFHMQRPILKCAENHKIIKDLPYWLFKNRAINQPSQSSVFVFYGRLIFFSLLGFIIFNYSCWSENCENHTYY